MAMLRFIQAYNTTHGYSPTLKEIGNHVGITKVTVFGHVRRLIEGGFLIKGTKHNARSLQISKDFVFPDEFTEEGKIPKLGRIAAGFPLDAIEDREMVSMSDIFPMNENLFMLEVGGDSMIEDHICEGDFVVCSRTENARDGQVVVALLENGEATLKRFYHEGDHVRLQPANKNYEPVIVDNIRIQGVMVGIIRKS